MTTLPEPSAGTGDTMIGSRYQIKSHVATGGTSDVYLAYDTQLRRDVIIKRLKEGYLGEESLQKIWSEAAKLASLRHANIVAIFDVVELDQSPSIIMEHLSGESIEQRAERKPFGAEEIVTLHANLSRVSLPPTTLASSTTTSSPRTSCSSRNRAGIFKSSFLISGWRSS